MHIEFERRLHLINPEFTANEKITSDIAFSFLNAAQERYVKINYVGDDQTVEKTNTFAKNVDSIKSLVVEKTLNREGQTVLGFAKFRLPHEVAEQYFLYIKSFSKVSGGYKNQVGDKVVANNFIKYDQLQNYATTAYNTPIIRKPAVAFMSDPITKYNYLIVATDKYTTLRDITLMYYRKPLRFDVLQGSNTLSKCELPDSVHNEIVDLAVDMFISEAKYRLNVKQEEQ